MVQFSHSPVLIGAALLFSVGMASAQELIDNGHFDSGDETWEAMIDPPDSAQADWLPAAGRDNSGCLYLRSEGADASEFCGWRVVLEDAPAFHRFQFSAWVKGRGVEKGAVLSAVAWDGEANHWLVSADAPSESPWPRGDFDWTKLQGTLLVPPGTSLVQLGAVLAGKGELWIDDVSMVVAEPVSTKQIIAAQEPGTQLPGLYRLRGEYNVVVDWLSPDDGTMAKLRRLITKREPPRPTLLIPVPLAYREQVPLTYRLTLKPPAKLANARIFEDRPDNFVAQLIFDAGHEPEEVELRWSSIVLCGPRPFDDLPPKAPFPKRWPTEAAEWLQSSYCVQAHDERIQRVAREIHGEQDDVLKVIEATLQRARMIFSARKGKHGRLDSVTALRHHGSCVSNANLIAALMRANNIPARILAGYPPRSGPLGTHYIIEAYVPGYGWYPIEPTLLKAPWPPPAQQHVAIIPVEYEDRAEHRPMYNRGTPFLSKPEEKHLMCMVGASLQEAEKRGRHISEIWCSYSAEAPSADWDAAVQAARRQWAEWVRSSPECSRSGVLASPLQPDDLADANCPAALTRVLQGCRSEGEPAATLPQ